jgi:hypothetical protein
MEKQRLKMSQDALYKYLKEHDVKISRVAEEMAMSPSAALSCFIHRANRQGTPRYFTVDNIAKLNVALSAMAKNLRSCVMKFGTIQVYTNKHGRVYDPGMITPLNQVGKYLNMSGVMERVLGWSKNKKSHVFSSQANKNYGNISKEDIDNINMEIISVASFFESIEIVPDENVCNENESTKTLVE